MFDNFNPKEIKVALLAGGKSNERTVSLNSAKGASSALEEAGFQVTQLDPADKSDLTSLITDNFDVAFLVLHGKGGEDGTIQGFLESIDLPYTGSGIWSSATSINKAKAKNIYIENTIPTPKALTASRTDDLQIDDVVTLLGEKCVVKAATEGSSIGVYITETKEELAKAIKEAFDIDETIVIEQYIKGPEFSAPVLESDNGAINLPLIEIIPKAESYDFESKYAPGGSEHICPARLNDAETKKMQDLAMKAHKALECSGVSRTDFIVDENGDMWALETNTLPGMTTTSLVPDAAKVAGIPFSEVCTMLIKNAFAKAQKS